MNNMAPPRFIKGQIKYALFYIDGWLVLLWLLSPKQTNNRTEA